MSLADTSRERELEARLHEADKLLAAIYSRLHNMGFGEDEPINGGDCVDEVVDGIYRLIKKYREQS